MWHQPLGNGLIKIKFNAPAEQYIYSQSMKSYNQAPAERNIYLTPKYFTSMGF